VPLWQAIILGAVQGLTEFLPISSTAHLALIPWAFGWRDPGLTFDVALHVGTLAAVLIYFWKVWRDLIASSYRAARAGKVTAITANSANCREVDNLDPADSSAKSLDEEIAKKQPSGHRGSSLDEHVSDPRLLLLIMVGTVPGAVVGLIFEKHIETTLRSPFIMGTMLVTVALLMAYADKLRVGTKKLQNLGLSDATGVGFAQALALIPGVSRSGITMTAGLFMHFQRDAAARFSFLLSTPIIAGACLKKFLDVQHQGVAPEMAMPFAAGALASAIVGYATIAYFIKYLQFGTFRIFVYYRIIIGIMVLALASFYRLNLNP
jgi:undecaprenyl-diphosphatase